jgi:hypothetical protein
MQLWTAHIEEETYLPGRSYDHTRRLHDLLFAVLLFDVGGSIAGVGARLELDRDGQDPKALGWLLIDNSVQLHPQVQAALPFHTMAHVKSNVGTAGTMRKDTADGECTLAQEAVLRGVP